MSISELDLAISMVKEDIATERRWLIWYEVHTPTKETAKVLKVWHTAKQPHLDELASLEADLKALEEIKDDQHTN